MTTPIPSGRVVRRLAALFGLALLLNFLPIPNFGYSQVSVLDRVPLPAMSDVGASELPQLQAAVDEPPATTQPLPTTTEAPPTTAPVAASELPSEVVTQDRVTGTADQVPEFAAIGVLLDEAPTEPILVRVQASDSSWGDWRELGVESDEGPDANPGAGQPEGNGAAYGTEPLWVEDAIGYELNLSSEDAPTAEVALVRDETKRTVTEAVPVAGAAVPTPFGIHMRTEWGARSTSTSVGSTVKLAVVHHSASSNDYSPTEVPGVLRSIQAYHMDGRGWSDIAYNFVVDKYGGIWEGRGGGIDKPIIGAHAMGFNTNSVGVMVIGDYTAAQPTAAALESVSQVIGWKLALHRVDPAGRVAFTSLGSTKYDAGVVVDLPRVVGHQDIGLTGCPGSIQNALSNITNRTQDWATYVAATLGPIGSFGGVVPNVDGTLTAIGWVVDLDVSGPTTIVATSRGRSTSGVANVPRSDVAALYPDQGPDHGFWLQLSGYEPGWWEVCISAVNRGDGVDTFLGCRSAVVPERSGRSPYGNIAASSPQAGVIDVSGSATDPDAWPIEAQITVDGAWRRSIVASSAGNSFGGRLLGIPAGIHLVCATGINGGVGSNQRMDCEWLLVGGANPIGGIDAINSSRGIISATGWAYDPESLDSIVVAMIIDGQWFTSWSNGYRGDWRTNHPGYGDSHGFGIGAKMSKGEHWTCLAAMNTAGGVDTMLGCQNIVVK
ncbi:N-acetylmuramoyl-L-alanine amidase [Actinobacteria bacterium IMCC26207]|nr:N-acetylmuramoyl-L-alanine amidase [Actinobacteria bacterium IMCC26207]